MKTQCILFFLLFFAYTSLRAQDKTADSYAKAKALLDASIQAHGGWTALQAVQSFSLEADGRQYQRHQSRRPEWIEQTPRTYDVALDLKNNRYRMLMGRSGMGRPLTIYYDVFDGKQRLNANGFTRTKNARPAAQGWQNQYPALFLPQFVLLNARARPAQLRYQGKTILHNRPHEIISYASADGTVIWLYLDKASHLLTKQESLQHDDATGDALSETIYTDYRAEGAFQVPRYVVSKLGGDTTTAFHYVDVRFHQPLSEVDVKLGEDFTTVTPPAPAADSVLKLSDHLYVFGAGGYRVLFADFKDYIWVMEAPAGRASQMAIAKIKETLPGKAIRYLTLSHHHIDHSAGMRAYVAEGATIVTTRGNKAFLEKLVKANYTLMPDALSAQPRPLKMEFVENKKRVFADGVTTVELYDIGPSPHADELLVAYLPKEKILFQADLFDGAQTGRSDNFGYLARWMEKQGLPVAQIIPVHGTISTIAEFKAALEWNEKAEASVKSSINEPVPDRRAHHELVYDEATQTVLLTGGSTPLDSGKSFAFFNDLWRFNGKQWKAGGKAGDERSGIRLAYHSKQKKIFSYGGFANNQSLADLRVLENSGWKTLSNDTAMKAAEPGFVYDEARDRLIAFGGSAARGQLNNATWEWDGKSWKKITADGPGGRIAFAMVYDARRKKTVLFGGMNTANHQQYNDTWEYDGKTWTLVDTAGPSRRASPGFAYDVKRGQLVVFGGMGENGMLGDTWAWNGKHWKKLADGGPSPRAMGYLAYDKKRDRVVLFGGRKGWPNDLNDTWEWDGKEWKEIRQ
jgi:glyoxylase-like metal-dependent hydrolase (beta-lactamase superfamily II)